MRLGSLMAVATMSLAFATGCGTGTASRPGTDGAGTTDLRILVSRQPGAGRHTYTLRCGPPGGTHPRPAAACRLLRRLPHPFAPLPANAMCAEIYGGPQTATVTGTWRGEPVHAQFRRTNGCEIARWDRHAALLVEPGGVPRS